jgi:hypothetical protein
MNIETKYNIGDKPFYFHCESLRFTQVRVIGLEVIVNEAGEQELLYVLNVSKLCLEECSLIDDITAFLMSDTERTDIVNLKVPERLLFDSWFHFEAVVNPRPQYTTPVNTGMEFMNMPIEEDVNT